MNLLKPVDYFLDRITMYRLVLYFLICLIGIASVFSLVNIISYSVFSIVGTAIFLIIICWATNTILAKVFKAPTNLESVYITALILALIISPIQSQHDFIFSGYVGILAIASKYILAINKKHLFNPAAISLTIMLLLNLGSASWWVGTASLAPFVALGSFLIIRKLHFEDMVWSFLVTAVAVSLGLTLINGGQPLDTLTRIILNSHLLFLAGVMLTEPLTLPPTKNLKMIYGAIVGFLSVPQINILGFYFAPELALSIGNLFAYLVSPKQKLILKLSQKIQIAPDIIDFIFNPNQKLNYLPGQYMEWTLSYPNPDSRGNRRYFTLASSPTEDNVRLGIKFYPNSSSYKKVLSQFDDQTIVGSQLAGDFTLPKNKSLKLVLIAGGIGITPFRSMIKYLIDKEEKRDIILIYSNKTESEIVYKDIFDQASKDLGIKTIYTLTEKDSISNNWTGYTGRINQDLIRAEIPDFKDRQFYISGPQTQIDNIKQILKDLGVSSIKTDYFPGLV